MNVQRLIEKYKKLEGVWDAEGAELARQIFLEDLKQLDEQKPVKVPQCVADWYEANKDNLDYNIWEYIYEWDNQKKIRIQKLVQLFKRSIQNPRQHEPIRLRGRGREAVFGDFKK